MSECRFSHGPGHCHRPAADDGWCHAHYPDEIAIERATQGYPVRLFPHERVEAVRRLAARGFTDTQVAERLGISRRAAVRIRARWGIESRYQAQVIDGLTICHPRRKAS